MTDPNHLTLRDWERTMRAERKAPRTIRMYLDCAGWLANWLGGDLLAADTEKVRGYMADQAARMSAQTCASRYRALQQFYKWALAEELISENPMARMRPPSVPEKPVPLVSLDDVRRLLAACDGKGFLERRDTALVRLMLEPGGMRLGEVSGVRVGDVDMDQDVVVITGKGDRTRAIPFGHRTGQALTRYLRVRAAHPQAEWSDALWLAQKGPLTPHGVGQVLARRSRQARITHVHPHQLRHTAAHEWLLESGGDETSAMRLFGWRSRQMLQRYGASGADARAHAAARRLSLGDRI